MIDQSIVAKASKVLSTLQSKCLHIAILGAPNAGKSTLLNRIMGEKVSIVSPRAQTTRTGIEAIHTINNTQLVFFDTPGVLSLEEQKRLRVPRSVLTAPWASIDETDEIAVVVDASQKITPSVLHVLEKIKNHSPKIPISLILNKVDLPVVTGDGIAKLVTQLAEKAQPCAISATFPLSAATGKGVDALIKHFEDVAVQRDWTFPASVKSTMSPMQRAEEEIREQLYQLLKKEFPYQIKQEQVRWEQLRDGSLWIEKLLIVKTEAQKRILIGEEGEMIKKISMRARENLQRALNTKVHLFLRVKVQ